MPAAMRNAYYNKGKGQWETSYWTSIDGKAWFRKFGGDRVSSKDVENVKPNLIRS
jgi:hypothetical protein